jgi:protein SCO1/2
MDRAVPISLLRLQFTDELGKAVSLSNFVGRAVFLVPFLTSCQEECPVTTGALLAIKRALLAAHLQRKVALVEVTVDPRRDQPERLSAYARLTGVSWHLLTGSSGDLENLWRFFGIYSQAVPEGAPPGIDWQTAKPYTYDVDHSDGFIVLDPKLRERFVAAGMVRGARLSPELRRLLDSQGLRNLNHPGGGSWSIAQALDAISWVLGGS